ncbi:MAG: thiol-disulfide isomerase [Bryobacteraceae bacterium]|nr:thiol-disulfide isomerase [Bryobacteraceae bacterium]
MFRTLLVFALIAAAATTASAANPTFYKDVLPVLQERCQECHRAGEIGPMTLFTYKETRPWAKSIREVVRTKKMPPWFANPNHGKFVNDRSLSQSEIDILAAWSDTGAAEGSPKDAPAPKQWTSGWGMPVRPDVVIGMKQPFSLPAAATIDYQYIVIPTGFTEDKWVQMVEARPSNRGVVHHAVVFVRGPADKWLRGEAKPFEPWSPPKTGADGKPRQGDIDGFGAEFLTVYTPGNLPDVFKPGQARLIKAGSDLVLQMHYTTNGKPGTDLTQIGLVFSKEKPLERIITVAVGNSRFVIPPGDPAYRVPTRFQVPNDSTILSFFPHMHVRGKGFEYKVQLPGEEMKTMLQVDNYNFNWQLSYRLAEPLKFPAGTRFEFTGIFDNSPNNPYNPDPKSQVRFGEQSWEEMSIGFFDLAVPLDMDRKSFFRRSSPTPPAPRAE